MKKRPSVEEVWAQLEHQALSPTESQRPAPAQVWQSLETSPTSPYNQPPPVLNQKGNGTPYEQTQTFGQQSDYDIYSGNKSMADEYATPPNTPLTAPKGKWEVVSAYGDAAPDSGHVGNFENEGWGNNVVLRNVATGEQISPNHMNSVAVQPGQIIEGGTPLGVTGHTGNSTGPHVAITYKDAQGNPGAISQTPYADIIPQQQVPSALSPDQQAPQLTPTVASPTVSQSTPTPEVALDKNYYAEGTPDQYKPIIDKASKETGIPTHVLSSQIKAESNFDPKAQSPYASGLAQFTPDTAAARGVNPADPESAIRGMATYDKEIMNKHGGNTDLGLGGYNAGPGAVEDGQLPDYPETQNYVKKINDFAKAATASAQLKTKPKPKPDTKTVWQRLLGV